MAFNTPQHKSTMDFGSPEIPSSPLLDLSIDYSETSGASLEFLNAQLIAHGFTSKPGLCLDGTDAKDAERVVRCILGLLGQRMQDVNRTEALSSNLRTLTYENERLKSMHKSAVERADNAEREANAARAKLAATKKTLDETISAHKGTTAELTRTRTLMQGIRATHAAELRKRDKTLTNFPPNTTTSYITFTSATCLNSNIQIPQDKAILEAALEDAEKARKKAINEIRALREVVRDAVNGVNRHAAGEQTDKPYYTLSQLFPISPPPPAYAAEKLENALKELKGATNTLKDSQNISTPPLSSSTSREAELEKEITAMVTQLESLKAQLAESNRRAATEAKALMERPYATTMKTNPPEPSIDQITASQINKTETRLNVMRKQLEDERTRFTEERAALEVERKDLAEEKRKWETEKTLSNLSPTLPDPTASPKPARKSERVKKSKLRLSHSRRSSVGLPPATPGRGRVSEMAYETEVVNMEQYLAPPESTMKDKEKPLLPDAFVLPPPTPRTSWPSAESITSVLSPAQPPTAASSSSGTSSSSTAASSTAPKLVAPPPALPPKTPSRFPVAKPSARNMIHAYSPVKPSPLSRILSLGGSPDSSGGSLDKLDTVEEAEWEEEKEREEEEGRGLSEEDLFPPVEHYGASSRSGQPIRKMARKVNTSSPTKPKIMPIRARTAAAAAVPSRPLHLSPKKSRPKDVAAAKTARVVPKPNLVLESDIEKQKKSTSSSQRSTSKTANATKATIGTKPAKKAWS